MCAFTFQELDIVEILRCLSDAGINATEKMITQPKPSTVYRILKEFFLVITNFEKAELSHPHYMLDQDPDPELAEGFVFLNFYRGMKDLMKFAAVDNFCFADLYKPDEQRFKYLLSGIINFAKFREDRVRKFTEHNQQATELQKENDSLENEIKLLEEAIQAQKTEHEKQMHEIDELRSQKISYENKLSEFQNAREYLTESINKFKGMISECQSRITKINAQTKEQLSKAKELKDLLSQSPDEVNSKVMKSKDDLEKEIREVEELEKTSLSAKKRQKLLGSVRENIILASDALIPLVQDQKKYLKIQEEKKVLEKERKNYENKMKEIQELREMKIKMEKEQKQEAAERRDVMNKIKEHKKTLRRLGEEKKNRIDYDIGDQVEALSRKIKEYNDNLNQAMNECDQAIQE
ncbi:kinetochore protein Nuf2 [Histomonas meleagridis]|uniref:kinetochore protein Nuf2 n=1 Tax=Histomonas meleagridis TaxID=135588 RepID=UPI00355AB534|nr:kinetochore protein Nuf2 [Histomonas meleagridis]KAH0803248.1 kinetochore protein Nuf2 [Histomonas meleagridis]